MQKRVGLNYIRAIWCPRSVLKSPVPVSTSHLDLHGPLRIRNVVHVENVTGVGPDALHEREGPGQSKNSRSQVRQLGSGDDLAAGGSAPRLVFPSGQTSTTG